MEERHRERWYEAPRMELVEVAVEHGFAVSDVTVGGWGDGGSLGGGEAEDVTPVIDGTLGGKTEATEEDLAAMVEYRMEEHHADPHRRVRRM